ncbi:MAG: hypothetical protein KDC45_10870 [Bacteroidetes bacterium]|nr:hypothetical protein [Bacteroidota bacterium]
MKKAVVWLLLPFFVSCYDRPDLAELRNNRLRWETRGISNYTYEFQAECFCSVEFSQRCAVRVDNDTVTSVTIVETQLPVVESKDRWKSIEQLFDIAQYAIEHADRFMITYDETYGYPSRIEVDYYTNAVDDEITFKAANLISIKKSDRKD